MGTTATAASVSAAPATSSSSSSSSSSTTTTTTANNNNNAPAAAVTARAATVPKPGKSSSAIAKRFDSHLQLLSDYKDAHEGQDPPREHSVQHEGVQVNLGKWCHNQRQKKTRGQLSQDFVAKLDTLDFSWGSSPESTWMEYYLLLKEYKAAHAVPLSEPDPPPGYTVERDGRSFNLGTWCRTQRYRKNSQKLSIRRQDLLKELNFTWGRSPENAFDEFLLALKVYRDTNGASRSPAHVVASLPRHACPTPRLRAVRIERLYRHR